MPNCPKCEKPVYFAERKSSLGKDWHSSCLRCERCNKTLTTGSHAEHDGKPYCHKPCYAYLFGPTGYGRGGVAESFIYDKNAIVVNENGAATAPPLPTQPQPTPQATN